MFSLSGMSGILAAAYLNQLSASENTSTTEKSSTTSQSSTSFQSVLQNQRARQINQENYNRLKEAAGGKVSTTKTYTEKQSTSSQDILYQSQKLLMNQTFLYGMLNWKVL